MSIGDELKQRLFAERNEETGLIELIDCLTGKVVAVQGETLGALPQDISEAYTEIQTPQGLVWVPKTFSLDDHYKVQKTRSPQVPYSETLIDLIANELIEGKSLSEILGKKGFPSRALFARWRREYPFVEERINWAYKERAESLRDRVREANEQVLKVSDRQVKNYSVYMENLKWLASKDDPKKYGAKVEVQGSDQRPIVFNIDTGIRRPGDAGYIDVTSQTQIQGAPLQMASVPDQRLAVASRESAEVAPPVYGEVKSSKPDPYNSPLILDDDGKLRKAE